MFGTVYTTNGVDSSQYFETFSCVNDTSTCNNTIQFNLNVQGILLPGSVWESFQDLLTFILPGTICDQYDSGVCTLEKATCDDYQSTLEDYAFKVTFASTDSYIRVPLATFAYQGTTNCMLQVEYSQDNTIVMGGLFF